MKVKILTWLMAIVSFTSNATLIAYWNFNDSPTGVGNQQWPTTIQASHGVGEIKLDNWAGKINADSGDGLNALFGNSSGHSLTLDGLAGDNSYIDFSFSMHGLSSLNVSYAARSSVALGYDFLNWSYSEDGVNFSDVNTLSLNRGSFAVQSIDTNALDQALTSTLRLTLSGASADGAYVRLDNIQLNAVEVPEPPVLILFLVSVLAFGLRKYKVHFYQQ